jgi:hypothetical protein
MSFRHALQHCGGLSRVARRSIRTQTRAATPTVAAERSAGSPPQTLHLELVEEANELDQGFEEYKAATLQMAELERLSSQLLENLQEINAMSMQTLVSCVHKISAHDGCGLG